MDHGIHHSRLQNNKQDQAWQKHDQRSRGRNPRPGYDIAGLVAQRAYIEGKRLQGIIIDVIGGRLHGIPGR